VESDKNNVKVSVLMTAYNREKYISEAIESVLASSFKDFELIIVDDCSSDRTVEIAKLYEAKDNRVKVYLNETNLGDYPNRNKAASLAIGKYIKFVDSDDKIYKYGLSILVESMEDFPMSSIGIATMPMLDKFGIYPIELNPIESNRFHFVNKIGVFSNGPLSAILRSDFFKESGGFSTERMVSDFKFWLDSSIKGNILLIQDGVVWNRVHPGQELIDVLDFKYRYSQIEVDHLSKLKSLDMVLFKQIQKELLKNHIRAFIREIIKGKVKNSIKSFNILLKIRGLS
jgi:glycosyltransferase involved in cell wall biosynthesis